jgi:hypothetical protein
MTARSVSWTDPKSIALLLERASGSSRAARPPAAATRASTRTRAATATRPIPAPVEVKPPQVPKAPEPKPVPKLEQTSDNPSDRLDTLVAWTLDHQPCTGAFVADDNGLTLAAHGISEAHVSLVGPLLSALVSIRSIPGINATAGALLLGENIMSWVEARTERGGFCLGAVGPEPLSALALEQLKEALETTLTGL